MNHEQWKFSASIDEYDRARIEREVTEAVGSAHLASVTSGGKTLVMATREFISLSRKYGIGLHYGESKWETKLTSQGLRLGRQLGDSSSLTRWHPITDPREPCEIIADLEAARKKRREVRVECWGVDR